MNRIHNAKNPNQGDAKKVLCVCSAGLLRSPTAAEVLSRPPFNFNTRSAGAVQDYALIHADAALIAWADEIVCMQEDHVEWIDKKAIGEKPVIVLGIPDSFQFRDPELVTMIAERYQAATDLLKANS